MEQESKNKIFNGVAKPILKVFTHVVYIYTIILYTQCFYNNPWHFTQTLLNVVNLGIHLYYTQKIAIEWVYIPTQLEVSDCLEIIWEPIRCKMKKARVSVIKAATTRMFYACAESWLELLESAPFGYIVKVFLSSLLELIKTVDARCKNRID